MNRLLAYTLVSFLLSSFSLVAAPAHLRMMAADTVDTAQKLYDDLQIPDSLAAALDSAFADTISGCDFRNGVYVPVPAQEYHLVFIR